VFTGIQAEDARAYVYAGDWVADCTRPDCYNAEFLFELRQPGQPVSATNVRDVRKTLFVCSNCRQIARIDWPDEEFRQEADLILSSRPVPSTRGWYPADHAGAVKLRVEHGQSLEDLREENRAHGVPA
jgi:hypothetical protein